MSSFFAEEPDWYRSDSFSQPTAIDQPDADLGALRIAVALVERDADERARLAQLVGDGASEFSTLDELAPRLGGTPVVAILGPSCSTDGTLSSADRFLQ